MEGRPMAMNPRQWEHGPTAPAEYAELVRGGDCLAGCTADELEDEIGCYSGSAPKPGRRFSRSKNRAQNLEREQRK
jgi:hypothetical protein